MIAAITHCGLARSRYWLLAGEVLSCSAPFMEAIIPALFVSLMPNLLVASGFNLEVCAAIGHPDTAPWRAIRQAGSRSCIA